MSGADGLRAQVVAFRISLIGKVKSWLQKFSGRPSVRVPYARNSYHSVWPVMRRSWSAGRRRADVDGAAASTCPRIIVKPW